MKLSALKKTKGHRHPLTLSCIALMGPAVTFAHEGAITHTHDAMVSTSAASGLLWGAVIVAASCAVAVLLKAR